MEEGLEDGILRIFFAPFFHLQPSVEIHFFRN